MIFDHKIISENIRKRETCFFLDDIYNHPLQIYSSLSCRWSQDVFFARKSSNIFGIEMITAGNAIFTQSRQRYLVNPGELYLLRKKCEHHYQTGPAGFLHKRCVVIGGPLLEPLLLATGLHDCDYIVPPRPNKICDLFRRIHFRLRRKETALLPELSELAYRLVVELGKIRQPVYPQVIRQALDFMEANLSAPITAEQIAQSTGLSLTHFNRLFKEHMNQSPIAWFIQKKMTRAQYLLEHTLMSVKEVATSVGYDEPFYFSSQFKKFCGMSPKFYANQYRRSHTPPYPASPEVQGPCYLR
jgi:AraC-like DNA-binding protein